MPSCSSNNSTGMDIVYPEPMSLLYRRVVPKKRRGTSARYRTQPVTFHEIQEVDEENLDDAATNSCPQSRTSRSELNILNSKFEAFKRSRDFILSGKSELSDSNSSDSNSKPAGPVPINAITTSKSSSRLVSRPSI